MSSSDVDDDHRSVLLSPTMESIEVVVGGEALNFIEMKRKPGGLLDLVCESGEKRNMKRDFCDRTRGANLADLVLRLWSTLAMSGSSWATARVVVQGEGVSSRRGPTRRLRARSSRQ